MEIVVPIVIVTIGIGLVLLFLRRPTVVRPPTDPSVLKTSASTATPTTGDAMQELMSELKTDLPPDGTKRVTILKGNKQIGWTVTRRVEHGSLSPDDLRSLLGKGATGQLASDLLAKLASGSAASGPAEARLQYPGSSLVVDSFDSKQSTAAGSMEPRDVYKTTLATEADAAQVVAWYRDWLVGHGWQLSPSTAANAASSEAYVRASEHFRLTVADPATVTPILAMPIPVGTKTIYEVEYSNTSTQPTSP
ncbi:MAG TPA: hypothetical protein VJT14_13140 [Candidatus Dormibacteraeota bacterium]|nr:hypothetical protein [Candidatus Dormibacteraeota bacterium]